METIVEYEAFAARRRTILAALLLGLGEGSFVLLHGRVGLSWMYLVHATIAVLVALALWRHPAIGARWSLAAFLVLALPLLPIFWLSEARGVAEGMLWQPLIGRKLILLGLALLTPRSLAVAALLVAAFMGESLLLWWHLELGHNPIAAAAGEPWVTLIYFSVTSLLIVQRGRSRRIEGDLLRAQVEAKALGDLMQVSLAARDHVNTPLQALQLGVTLLKRRHPDERITLDRMSRAIDKLVEVSRGLEVWTETEKRMASFRTLREFGAHLERVP